MTLEAVGSLRQFLASRLARLCPAYWVAVMVTTAVACLMEPAPPALAVIAVNMTMTEMFFRTPYIDASYWTLGVEMQFYIVIGLIFACGWLRRIDALCLCFLAAVTVYRSALLVGWLAPSGWVEESFVEYGAFFIIGVCMSRSRSEAGTRLPLRIMLMAVLSTTWGGGRLSLSPGGVEYFACTAALTLLVWLAVNDHARLLRWRPLVFLGGMSYALYLVHQRIGVSLSEALHRQGTPAVLAVGLATLAVGMLAFAIHLTVENPGRRHLRKLLAGPWSPRVPATQT